MPMKSPYNLDLALGLTYYYTTFSGIGGSLRNKLDDFVVEEILPDRTPILSIINRRSKSNGIYTHCIMKKVNWSTIDALKKVARAHKIGMDRISYAGIKDKKAVTYQRICIWNIPPSEIISHITKGIDIIYSWREEKPVKLGELWGNKFDIIIRKTSIPAEKAVSVAEKAIEKIISLGGVPNYFGYQRFGVHRPITHMVGKMLLKNKIEEAVKFFLGEVFELEGEDAKEGRTRLKEDWNYRKALSYFPKRLKTEIRILEYLAKHETDYIGALLNTPKSILKMFIHAYQSYLFNIFLSKRLELNLPLDSAIIGDLVIQLDDLQRPIKYPYLVNQNNISLINKNIKQGKMSVVAPLIGYSTKFPQNEWGEFMQSIIEQENIQLDDFKSIEIKMLRSKGSYRELLAPVYLERHPVKLPDDGIRIIFSLKSSTYATVMLREIMKSPPTAYV